MIRIEGLEQYGCPIVVMLNTNDRNDVPNLMKYHFGEGIIKTLNELVLENPDAIRVVPDIYVVHVG